MVKLEQEPSNDAANNLSDNTKYYEPGTYKYDSGSYVPTYQDSIYLSKTTGESTVTEVTDTDAISKGICSHYKDYPEKLESECNKLDKNICASTDCCVLFGVFSCPTSVSIGVMFCDCLVISVIHSLILFIRDTKAISSK